MGDMKTRFAVNYILSAFPRGALRNRRQELLVSEHESHVKPLTSVSISRSLVLYYKHLAGSLRKSRVLKSFTPNRRTLYDAAERRSDAADASLRE